MLVELIREQFSIFSSINSLSVFWVLSLNFASNNFSSKDPVQFHASNCRSSWPSKNKNNRNWRSVFLAEFVEQPCNLDLCSHYLGCLLCCSLALLMFFPLMTFLLFLVWVLILPNFYFCSTIIRIHPISCDKSSILHWKQARPIIYLYFI